MRELRKKTKIRRVTLPTDKRIIFVSDIHGDVASLKGGLKKVNFCSEDYLFIIGDIYEKGDFTFNLETVRYVMELCKNNDHVYPMSGNCDEVLRFILPQDTEHQHQFLYYTLVKGRSIINDMAHEMNYPLSLDMDVKDFVDTIQERYSDLYDFMDSLDDVIFINDSIVLVHGGIDDISSIGEYALPYLKYDNFYEKSKPQEKLMIVGHYPTRNYRADVSCVNPIFDFKKKIISIDGGNHIVKGGQVNIVCLESLNTMKFTNSYCDHYPKHTMTYDVLYEKPDSYVNVQFGANEIEILNTDLDFYYVKHVETKTYMWVHSSFVYQDPKTRKYYCYDASNQFISVKKGDVVSVVKTGLPYSVIKHNGYIGLIETKYLIDDPVLPD